MTKKNQRRVNHGCWRATDLAKGRVIWLQSGKIGVKEIERLIQKLEIDKEILADQDDNKEDKGIFE
jgi:hypothetical protein